MGIVTTFLHHALDLADAFAMLALAALAYAPAMRLFGRSVARWLGGVAFGVVAALQLMTPVMLPIGALIDMRALPVALAAAFLGWRGALPSLAIAAAARSWTGGGGAEAGFAALVLAAGAGLLWRRLTDERDRRGLPALECLGLLICLHLLPVFAAADGLRPALMAGVVPVLAVLNIAGAVTVGWLLEQARWDSEAPAETLASASGRIPDAGTGFARPRSDAAAETVCDLAPVWVSAGTQNGPPEALGAEALPDPGADGEVYGVVARSLFDRTDSMMTRRDSTADKPA
ncbi:LytS/YhcK type 5TM receptor domain-containing protein [Roseivivax sediminis]|uniref:5TMR of 5TMR-LYT n=1 Tax=Roseivivax sediminis TaxID=936889 RepID=A0A1I2C1J1_9RHOB|nr:LytS/YhcK type 5TM receptor domain-containing protein [Roseivivax sediminis]SFE62008.1 5TMR of 5TMR-LYT [Roseivivax sediminis]